MDDFCQYPGCSSNEGYEYDEKGMILCAEHSNPFDAGIAHGIIQEYWAGVYAEGRWREQAGKIERTVVSRLEEKRK